MPSIGVARRNLQAALDDFLTAAGGDTGRGPRSAQAGVDEFPAAKALRDSLAGAQRGEEQDSPGRRAARDASGKGTAGSGFDAAASRAKELLGATSTSGGE